MTAERIVQIAMAADGAPVADALRAALTGMAAVAEGLCPQGLRAAHENAVLVFLLTPAVPTSSSKAPVCQGGCCWSSSPSSI